MIAWDDLADAEQDATELRRRALGGSYPQLDAERAERSLARMEMGDDVDD
jgi:hypothetical protein